LAAVFGPLFLAHDGHGPIRSRSETAQMMDARMFFDGCFSVPCRLKRTSGAISRGADALIHADEAAGGTDFGNRLTRPKPDCNCAANAAAGLSCRQSTRG
jgi:hypothetical protein